MTLKMFKENQKSNNIPKLIIHKALYLHLIEPNQKKSTWLKQAQQNTKKARDIRQGKLEVDMNQFVHKIQNYNDKKIATSKHPKNKLPQIRLINSTLKWKHKLF